MGKVKYFVVCLIIAAISFIGYEQAAAKTLTAENDGHVNTAKPESTVPWEYGPETPKSAIQPLSTSPVIADISKWQGNIDWSKASKSLDLVIIRTQYGSGMEDYMHDSYEKSATKYDVPFGVYSYVLASTPASARAEARNFYNRASKNTKFYVLDVEEFTNERTPYTMRAIVEAYVDELRSLSNKKVGLYVANHLYSKLNLKTSDFDFVWIPRYSSQKPSHAHHLWQYTDSGRVPGISGGVDLNRLASGVSLSFFTGESVTQVSKPTTTTYYNTNPGKIVTKQSIPQFTTTALKTKKGTLKKGDIVKVKRVVKTANGTPRLQLSNGRYITANKKYVLKVNPAIDVDDYYTAKDKVNYALLKKSNATFTSVEFTDSKKADSIEKGKAVKVNDISYTAGGTPRLKLSNGRYVTAKKTVVQKVKDSATPVNYYTSVDHVNAVLVKQDEYKYKTMAFSTSTRGEAVPKNKIIKVAAVTYSSGGVPRLKLTSGQYMTAKKTIMQKVASNINEFYTEIPEQVVTKSPTYAYDGLYFGKASITNTIAANTSLAVKSIVYTSNGYPKFVLADHSIVGAEKALYH